MASTSSPVKSGSSSDNDRESTWLAWYENFDGDRSQWYDNATDAYRFARPRYPDPLVDRVCREAKLDADKTVLEIGCGPGTATLSFCKRGISMLSMDPSPSNCAAALEECEAYQQNLTIVESTFEDWSIPSNEAFHAVLCATSFHWIPRDIACSKIAAVLQKTGGPLVLLWAFPPHPPKEISDFLQPAYEEFGLGQLGNDSYWIREESTKLIERCCQQVNESGYFQEATDFHLETIQSKYSVERYIALLSTLSPYIGLEEQVRKDLLESVRKRFVEKLGGDNKEFEVTHWYGSQVSIVKKITKT
jgi:SAM-dependent methyltransferase